MYDLLGTGPDHKRHRTFDNTGHILPHVPMVRETVDWLDRYLGAPVGS